MKSCSKVSNLSIFVLVPNRESCLEIKIMCDKHFLKILLTNGGCFFEKLMTRFLTNEMDICMYECSTITKHENGPSQRYIHNTRGTASAGYNSVGLIYHLLGKSVSIK